MLHTAEDIIDLGKNVVISCGMNIYTKFGCINGIFIIHLITFEVAY